jgi:hypothetical protein
VAILHDPENTCRNSANCRRQPRVFGNDQGRSLSAHRLLRRHTKGPEVKCADVAAHKTGSANHVETIDLLPKLVAVFDMGVDQRDFPPKSTESSEQPKNPLSVTAWWRSSRRSVTRRATRRILVRDP